MTTGKNKKQFKIFYETINGGNYKILYQNFMAYPFEMQIGVYLAYYDNLGVWIDVSFYKIHGSTFANCHYQIKTLEISLFQHTFNTRNEAYQEAFKKANELLNEKLK